MKLVDFATFLSMPPGTVYAKYKPAYFYDFGVKWDTLGTRDFVQQQIVDSLPGPDPMDAIYRLEDGESVPVDLDRAGRDGNFDESQQFAVWEPEDVAALIDLLKSTLTPRSPEKPR